METCIEFSIDDTIYNVRLYLDSFARLQHYQNAGTVKVTFENMKASKMHSLNTCAPNLMVVPQGFNASQ